MSDATTNYQPAVLPTPEPPAPTPSATTDPTPRAGCTSEGQAYLNAAAWHEQQIAEMRRKILKAEEWSAENNDGARDLGGTLFTEYMPRWIEAHEKSARHFRRLARQLARAKENADA